MQPLFLFLFLLAGTVVGVGATAQMGRRTELEASVVCYQRHAPQIWNAFIEQVLPKVAADVDALARAASMLRELLRDRVPAAQAVTRAAGHRGGARAPLAPAPPALLMCLNAAHSASRAAVFSTRDRELAAAANARMYATREESLTYAEDPAEYSDELVRRVAAAARARAPRAN